MNTTENKDLITRKQYMENAKELHHAYFLQFATGNTRLFVLSSLSVQKIQDALNSGDEHLNKIKIPYNNTGRGNGWWWDSAPINMELLRAAGESNSPSTHTCVAKAMAKELAKSGH